MELLGNKVSASAIGIGSILVILFVTSFWVFSPDDSDRVVSLNVPVARVVDGPFDVYVVESAILDARQSVTLASELPSNKAKVLSLAGEGNLIRKGEIVATFDPTPFEEEIQKIEGNLKEEQAKLVQEEAELNLQKGDIEDRLENLKYQIELAELKITTLQEGSVPLRLARSDNEMAKGKANYDRAKEARIEQEELFNAGFVNADSVSEARIKEQEQFAEFQIRERNARTLKDITIPAEIKRAQLEADNRKRELDGFENTRLQKNAQRNAAIVRLQNKIEKLQQSLEGARQHLENTTIRAPVSGIVLYKEISLQNEKRKAQVGDSLWSRHSFAVIPDMSSLVAFVNVRESDVGKITEGQTVTVQPEAYSNLILKGKVESIGTLAADDEVTDKTNFFKVRIALADIDERLRPGMTAKASILARHYEYALRIPVEAVFYDNQRAVCFLWQGGNPRRQNIKLGGSDGNFIVVEEGLSQGQEVMLTYPDSFDS